MDGQRHFGVDEGERRVLFAGTCLTFSRSISLPLQAMFRLQWSVCESSYVPDALRLLFLSSPTLCALALLFYHYSEVSPKPTAPFPFSYLRLSRSSFPYLRRFPFRLSPISANPYLFPDSHERSLVIAPLLRFLLISSPIAAVPTLAAQLACRGNPSLCFSHGP